MRFIEFELLTILALTATTIAAPPTTPDACNRLVVDLASMDSSGKHLARLRTFHDTKGATWMLALDAKTLTTSVRPAAGWRTIGQDLSKFDSSSWGKLRRNEHVYGWKSSGLSHLLAKERGIVLSVDLCPSRKPLDRHLVRRLWEVFRTESKPVPISFALSGAWIRAHEKDLAWLVSQTDSGHIDPTWINHTDRHAYIKGIPDNRNFLFLPGTDVEAEVLGAEAEMIRHGVTPSVFFRFPGLMDNEILFATVLGTGLLPVGSDAWLAKNQKPGPGSIVLIHGNGNEHVGVVDFLQLLDRHKDEIKKRTWQLEDLSEELEEETESVKSP